MALGAVTDNRRGLAVARPELEGLERGIDTLVLRGVDAVHLPVERLEHALELGHREDHAVGDVELAVVAIDEDAEVVEVLLPGVHHRFPDRPFLQLAVAGDAVGVEPRRPPPGDGEALRDGEPLSHGAGRDVDAGKHRSGVAVEDAGVGTRVAKDRAIEVAELGVDRRQRRHGVALAEDEEILAPPGGIGDVDVQEAAVVQAHEGNRRRERTAGVEALVDCVAALLEAEEPDVRVLDRQQFQDALAQAVRVSRRRQLGAMPGERDRLRVHPAASVSAPAFAMRSCSWRAASRIQSPGSSMCRRISASARFGSRDRRASSRGT